MKLWFFILGFLTLTTHNYGQKIEKYIADVNVDRVNSSIKADFQIKFSELTENDTIKFFLHESSTIHSILSFNKPIEFKFTDEKLIGEDKAILIPTNAVSENMVEISYSIDLSLIKNPNFKYNPHWMEFNIYISWFPLNIEYGLFDYEIRLDTDSTIVGTMLTNDSILKSTTRTFDIPFVISDEILKTNADNGKITLYHQNVSDTIIQNIKKKSEQYFNAYNSMFGVTNADNLSITINSFSRTIVYARPQFISLSIDDKFTKNNGKTLAHEIGHLWWNKANVGNWEDWLNEAFAEYSSLVLYRNENGAADFEAKIKNIEKRIENLKPIWNIDKLDPNSNTILTYKGAYLLYQLENRIGTNRFIELMKETHQLEIFTTKDFLGLVAVNIDKKTKDWFKTKLRK
ncbi:hypothetical protein BFP77_09525 [Maribacter sp. 4U21]|uniref:M1 family aminopeptidase n=1 Tax=Maribacter sp. 4U21 TaxID=1889779 RepID=UPI000C15392A|nr:M1 family aminopeptidase [Maribacter sp. 4U21]PIB28407.1 hypothetical protein BFP77_09525 [Maribacter sp. 4U21]